MFLRAFLDKTFGLGYATPADRAWVNGGSPTTGYLSRGRRTLRRALPGHGRDVLLDWLSIVALLGIGVALILGIGMRVAAVSATALLGFMWLASLPLENHPVIDDHLIYAMVAIGLAAQKAGDTLGLGRAWADLPIVQRLPILR